MPPSEDGGPSDLARLARASLKASVPAAQALDERFERLVVLGQGAMGVVWRARDRKLGREVALKVLSPELEGHPEGVARLRREAEILARVSHPGIVGLLDFVSSPLALVLELVPGEPLSAVLARGDAAPRALAVLVAKVASAVQHAHEHGLVHRDLKPSNILVTEGGEPRVVDWGIARLLGDPAPLTGTGAVLGTHGYMAPEQGAGRSREADARADVWSLGAILWEAVTGSLPGWAVAWSDFRALAPWAPPALERLLRRALATDPAQRTPSAQAFALELEPVLRDAAVWDAAERARAARRTRADAAGSSGRVAAAPLVVGEKVGSLVLVAHLGTGGMGEVFRARDERLGRDVALKVVRPDRSSPARLARFVREIEAASRVRHPNLVAVHSTGVERGHRYLVTELVQGEALDDRLGREGPLPVREAASIGRRIALALDALHRAGIVHRDVKPANVIQDEEGEPRLLDLGVAKVEDQGSLTRTGEFVGSPLYAAPEQLADSAGADPRADVYSLGVMLHELATGDPPFRGATLVEVVVAKAKVARPISAARADGDAALDDVVRRCLESRPEDRFPTALALATALEEVELGRATRRPGAALAVAALAVASLAALVVFLVPGRGRGGPVEGQPGPAVPSPRAAAAPVPTPSPERPPSIEPGLAGPLASCARTKHARLATAIGSLPWRHPMGTTALAVLPGGARAVTSSTAGILLWDMKTGELLARFDPRDCGNLGGAIHLAVTGDGRRVVASYMLGGLVVCDVAERRALRRVDPGPPSFRAVDPGLDGHDAFALRESTIEQWDLETGEVRARSDPFPTRLLALARGPHNVAVAVGPDLLATWAPAGARPSSRPFNLAELRAVSVLRDGTILAVGGEGLVRRFRLEPDLPELPRWPGAQDRLRVLGVTSDESTVWGAGDEGGLRRWDARTGAVSELLATGTAPFVALGVDPAGAGGLALDAGGRFVWFEPAGAAGGAPLPGHEAGVSAIAALDGGASAVSAGLDGTVRSWDLASRRERWCRRFPARAHSLALSSDGGCVAVGFVDGTIACCSSATGEALEAPRGGLVSPRGQGGTSVAFLAGRRLAWTSGKEITLWDPASPSGSPTVGGLADDVDGLVALGGKLLATVRGSRVEIWNAERRAPVGQWAPGSGSVTAVGPADGGRAIVGTSAGTHVIDLAREKSVGHVAAGECAASVASHGGVGAVALNSGRVVLFRLAQLDVVDEIDLASSFDVPTAVAFSPDGASLLVGTARGLVLRFELGRELVSPR